MGKRKKGKQTGGNDEDNNVNADGIPATSIEIFQKVHEIMVNLSELEIYGMLVECDMDVNKAINRLLDTEQHSVEINQGENSNQNSELGNSDGHYVDQGGEHKLNSDEASTEQGISNQLASLSTTSSILVPHNSELTNVGIKRVPISSGKEVRFGKPPTRMISNDGTKMVDVVKRSLGLSPKETVTEATNPSSSSFIETDDARDECQESASEPNIQMHNSFTCPDVMVTNPLNQDLEATVKDDSPLHPSSETDAARDQLGESASVSNQNIRDEQASEANLQMQNSFACPGDIVHQRPYTSEQHSQCLNSFFDWSRPTSQSIPTPSSMTERQVPSGQYSNVINSPSSLPNHNNMRPSTFQKCVGRNNNNTLVHVMNSPNSRPEYNNIPASSAFQQHDGSNNNTYFHYRSPESMFSQYRNSNLLQSDTSIGPSAQQQSGAFSYSHWWSPNFRPSQQEQQSYTRIGDERSSTTSQNQQNSTSDPSDQTQQGNNGYGEEDDTPLQSYYRKKKQGKGPMPKQEEN